MLISWTTWTAACALAPLAAAFYPYEPKYGGEKDQTRRAAALLDVPSKAREAPTPRRPLTLPLRRVPLQPRENTYDIVNSADPKQKDSVAVDQDGSDLSYMIAVTIGSSKDEYHLLLDSAASNTWIMGQDCESEACGRHNTFGEGDSDTLKTNTKTFSITYGTGSVDGTTAEDTVHIGDISAALTFGLATNVSQEFNSYPMDGILGLGKGAASSLGAPQLLETLVSSKLISAKLFGLHLARAADGTNDGELDLGAVNKDRFDGDDLNWLDAIDNDDGFWEIAVADVGADSKMAGLSGKSAIIDSGTSFVFMPEDDAVALHKLIDGYTQSGETFTVPCSTTKDFKLKLGDTTYSISTKDWIGGTTGGGQCKSNVFGRQTFGANQWLLGDVFLKNVYAAFDLENEKVGFGTKSGSTSSTASASANAAAASSESTSSTPSTRVDPFLPTGTASSSVADPLLLPGSSATATGSASAGQSAVSTTSAQNQTGGGAKLESTVLWAVCIALGIVSLLT